MKADIDYLIKHYGGLKATAEALGIRGRQLYNLRNNINASKSLKKLVELQAGLIRLMKS